MTPWDSVTEKLIFAVPMHNSHMLLSQIFIYLFTYLFVCLFIYLQETPLNITRIAQMHLISSFRLFSVLLNGLFTSFFSVNG